MVNLTDWLNTQPAALQKKYAASPTALAEALLAELTLSRQRLMLMKQGASTLVTIVKADLRHAHFSRMAEIDDVMAASLTASQEGGTDTAKRDIIARKTAYYIEYIQPSVTVKRTYNEAALSAAVTQYFATARLNGQSFSLREIRLSGNGMTIHLKATDDAPINGTLTFDPAFDTFCEKLCTEADLDFVALPHWYYRTDI